jgi:hypothetical protein
MCEPCSMQWCHEHGDGVSTRTMLVCVPRRTNIGDAGAKALCDALHSNHTLSYIDVSGNELMDKSWQKLLVNMMKGKGSMAQQGRM